eukprot:scaffold918_cov126-Cylindrotheca_fusiformis.AAC.5
MWKGLTTNLSKHTCRFSEWPWPKGTPTFVDSNDMTAYLESYADEFVDPSCFKFQCQVDHIGRGDQEDYRVEWTDLETNSKHSKQFQGVVVATGFFSKPHWPQLDHTIVDETNFIHSSFYTGHLDVANETVAVVGSSFSALEISADVSKSAKWVVNVVPSIPWVLPRYIPSTRKKTILPVDLAFYQRTKDFPQLPEQTTFTPETSKARHELLESIVGGRQAQSPLGVPSDFRVPPCVAISDHYLDLVIDGTIDVVHGRFQGFDESGVKVDSDNDSVRVIPDITKVICCTGYECSLDDFIDPAILQTLEYDGSDTFSPLTLAWDTLHPSLPNLAFCGMYRGPYMGIMELQGRLAAKAISGETIGDLEQALEVSQSIRQHRPRAQFPHFDYVGEMDTLATQALSQDAFPKLNLKKGDIVSPAFYQSSKDEIARACQEEMEEEEKWKGTTRMPHIVASALLGSWKFDRRIVHLSSVSSSPMGSKEEHVYGTIRYSRPSDYVKYREDGFYELFPSKPPLNVFREYEYVVAENGVLEIYFVEGGQRAHLFLSLKFQEQNDQGYWVASNDHLCIKDLYKANFQIKMNGLTATEIVITYRVKGPAKDYKSTTVMTPKLQQ